MGISSYVIAGVAIALIVVTVASKPSKLDAVPTFGSSGWIGSWWGSFKYLIGAVDILHKGYEKHKSVPFKVATFQNWLVLVNTREHVEELQKAPADTLSFTEVMKDRFQIDHTMAPELYLNPYHIPIIRSRLTRNLGILHPELRNEIAVAFDDILDLKGNEWKSAPALSTVQQVICRASNRVFVGLPLCRDPDWIDLNIRYTGDIVKGSILIGLFPDLLKPIATRLFTSIDQGKRRGGKLLGPIIEQRRKYLNKDGSELPDKPNDFLSWMMDEAEGPELTVESLTTRMLVLNFAAIQTSSTSFTHTLFFLAANPQYIQPLREEVEDIVAKEGWSKAALGKMRKVDSFLKECQRLEGLNYLGLQRKALKDFTFSDGTFVPKGTVVATLCHSLHRNEAVYENALAFEPFRFAQLSEEDGENAMQGYVSTSVDFVHFGHGRQACPGRFFAANELKTILAHLVVTYDIKLEGDATRPQSVRFVTALLPDHRVKVMFRRRVN